MATFIKVTPAESELLRRNRDQVQGNRLQKVEGDEQRRTAAEIRKAQAAKPEEPSTRRLGQSRRDEPAASRLDDLVTLGHVWYDNWVTDSDSIQGTGYYDGVYSTGYLPPSAGGGPYAAITRTVIGENVNESIIKEVLSANGGVVTQLRANYRDRSAVSFDPRYIALPLGPGAFLLVTMGYRFTFNYELTSKLVVASNDDAWSEVEMRIYADQHPEAFRVTDVASTSRSKQRFFNAYVCTQTAVREVSVPAKLQPLLALLNPEPSEATGVFTVYPNWPDYTGSYTVPYNPYYYEYGTIPSLAESFCDPRIYATLNTFATDNGVDALLTPGSPAYKLFFYDDGSRTNTDVTEATWLYAYYTNRTDDYETSVSAPRYDYSVARGVTEPADHTTIYSARRRKLDYSTLGASAAYCQAMALALGFSSADLTP
jgi:hypothetical protein